MKTILATAYAVNPYKGSEDGMGWNFIQQIARFNKVIAITRENNRLAIEKYQAEHPDPIHANISFQYYDLPKWKRFWKRGQRGALLYFNLWQKGVIGFVKRQNIHFDIAHNLNFHNDWTPTFLGKLNKPTVWGPIGHHPEIPTQYLSAYGWKARLKNKLTWLVKNAFWRYSPGLKKAVQEADHICCMNQSVAEVLDLNSKSHSLMPSVATCDPGRPALSIPTKFRLISVGRLVPLKGFDLTIRAFAHFLSQLTPDERQSCELLIVGSGPELNRLKEIAEEERVVGQIEFIAWMERKELMEWYRRASVFLFPSHEGAGMVVAEALSFGLPVVCLDNCGPGEFIDPTCGMAIPMRDYQDTVQCLGEAVSTLFHDAALRSGMSIQARNRFEKHFDWNLRGEHLKNIYANLTP